MVFVPPCLPSFSVYPPGGYVPAAPPPNYSIIPSPPVVEAEPSQPEPAKPEPAKDESTLPKPRPVEPGLPSTPHEPKRNNGVKPAELARPEAATPPQPKSEPKPAEVPKPTEEPKKLQVPQIPGNEAGKDDDAKIPPLVPQLPGAEVPPLSIPQVPVQPGGKTSTSKASPLTGTPRVNVYPVDGPPPVNPDDRRSVGFFNHTDRELKLTVNGESVQLPSRSFVTAKLPATFNYKLGDGEEQQVEVPATAPGVEVVIRK